MLCLRKLGISANQSCTCAKVMCLERMQYLCNACAMHVEYLSKTCAKVLCLERKQCIGADRTTGGTMHQCCNLRCNDVFATEYRVKRIAPCNVQIVHWITKCVDFFSSIWRALKVLALRGHLFLLEHFGQFPDDCFDEDDNDGDDDRDDGECGWWWWWWWW